MPPANPNRPRFLIGSGEKYTDATRYVTGPKPPKEPAYSVPDAIKRLTPKVERTALSVRALPPEARPNGEAVALVTLHPEFLAKTLFPGALFASVGLRAVGSRVREVTPDHWTPKHKKKFEFAESIELYVAGKPDSFTNWTTALKSGVAEFRGADELARVEDVRPLESLDAGARIRLPQDQGEEVLLEAALHLPDKDDSVVIEAFKKYAEGLGVKTYTDLGVVVPGMAFAPILLRRSRVAELAKFSFLRSLRPAVKLRSMPAPRLTRSAGASFTVPQTAPFNPSIRVAVLDGGLPDDHGIPFVNHHITPGVTQPDKNFTEHGLAVTGALMWGSLHDTGGRPYVSVDHFRILDSEDALLRDVHAYRVLRRVQDVIETSSHDIFNLSLGPDISVEDDDVHAWTSTLDSLSSDGSRLIIAAAGNNGGAPEPLCRIQVPGDGVNCLCVGAADHHGDDWKRADYSAKGPGRRPGVTKPDVVAFGGGDDVKFHVIRRRGKGHAIDQERGTSYAAPLVTRAAAALRSIFSANLRPLTLKCLLIHTANPSTNAAEDVGWGRIEAESALPICPPNTARVIYQGELPPKQFLRAKIPIPKNLTGRIRITATICYATEVRASDPLNYTNSGVEVVYRPNASKHAVNDETGKPSVYAKTAPFFTKSNYASEEERRTRDRKWETVLHATKSVEASKLDDPHFDLHFIPRIGAMDDGSPEKIKYAMVISVHAPKHADIYERVLSDFPQLQALAPVQLPVTV
jgi:hypothetical protein